MGAGRAMTLGTVILLNGASLDLQCSTYGHAAGRCEHPPAGLGDHERAHVDQYMLLGPLFVPVYFCAAASRCATRWSGLPMRMQCTATAGGRGVSTQTREAEHVGQRVRRALQLGA